MHCTLTEVGLMRAPFNPYGRGRILTRGVRGYFSSAQVTVRALGPSQQQKLDQKVHRPAYTRLTHTAKT
jgi:hypothetical protein